MKQAYYCFYSLYATIAGVSNPLFYKWAIANKVELKN